MKAPPQDAAEQKDSHDQLQQERAFVVVPRNDVVDLDFFFCLHERVAERSALLRKLVGTLLVRRQCPQQTGDNVSDQTRLKSLKELHCWVHMNKKTRLSPKSDDVGEQMISWRL